MMASSSNFCIKCGYTTRYDSILMHTLPCRHTVCEFCLKDIPGLLDGNIFSCPVCKQCSQYVRPLEEVYGEAGKTHSHEERSGTGKEHRGASEVEKNEAIDEMFSQDERRQYDHHSEKLTLASSQNAPKNSQQKEHAHVSNRVNVRGNDYSGNPARGGLTNHDHGLPANHGQPANHGYYQQHSAKRSTEPYYDMPQHASSSRMDHTQNLRNFPKNNHPETKPHNTSFGPTESGVYETIPPITGGASYEPPVHERGTSAHSSERGDSSMLEEPSRRTPTIHIEDKDDGRGSTFCPLHNKPVYFFCPVCDVPICAACSEGEHKSHGATKIDDSPDDMNHDNNQVGSEEQHVNPERPPKCLYHDRPCSMVCKHKLEYICADCHSGYHCPRYWIDHVFLTPARSELLQKGKEFERKMNSVESLKRKFASTGESNIVTIMRETEALKMEINAATEKAKERLDAYKNDVVAKIDKVAGEKIYSCTTAVESLNSVTGFLQQARQMDMEFQREAERGQYLKAMRSVQQIEDVIGNIDKTITDNNIKEDKLGLQVKEEKYFRDPFKLTGDGLWSSLF